MKQVTGMVGRRFDRTQQAAFVALGDILLIAVFVTVGEIQHNTPPWEFPVRALETFVPFLVGWTITSLVGGLYTSDAWQFPRRALSWTIPAWVTAVLIAMAIRATPQVHGGVELTFVAVSMFVGLALLLPWRVAMALRTVR